MYKYCFLNVIIAVFFLNSSVVYAAPKTPLETNSDLSSFRDTIFLQGGVMHAGTQELSSLVIKTVGDLGKNRTALDKEIHLGITSHHLPTAAPFIGEFYQELWNTGGPRDTFIIIGPDHNERCGAPFAVSDRPYQTPFATLQPDSEILSALKKEGGAKRNDTCFEKEHSIGVQAFFLSYLYPHSRIVPILVSSIAGQADIAKIKNVLLKFQNRTCVIGSFDFSHYFSYQTANVLDSESEHMIKEFNGSGFSFRHIDSLAGARLVLTLAQSSGNHNVQILDKKNSFDFTGQGSNTTGYINADFAKTDIPKDAIKLVFVGDIMLSRNVGEVLKRQGNWNIPFQDSRSFLQSGDILFGNLENPISLRGKNVGSIYSFRADPRAFSGLTYAGFDALSIANNHIGDWGREALEDTIQGLVKNNIKPIGGGMSEEDAHTARIFSVKDTVIGLLGYTAVGSQPWEAKKNTPGIAIYDKKKMIGDIKRAKKPHKW